MLGENVQTPNPNIPSSPYVIKIRLSPQNTQAHPHRTQTARLANAESILYDRPKDTNAKKVNDDESSPCRDVCIVLYVEQQQLEEADGTGCRGGTKEKDHGKKEQKVGVTRRGWGDGDDGYRKGDEEEGERCRAKVR